MTQVKAGDAVKVHYKGSLKDNTVFDSSEGREPLAFTAGSGMVIKGFDNAVIGMTVGEKKTVEIPVHEAYGPPNPEMILQFPASEFPEELKPEPGLMIHLSDNMGNNIPATIVEVKDGMVTVDANTPLAGKDLIFDIELVSIG